MKPLALVRAGLEDVGILPLLCFQLMVGALALQAVLGESLELLVEWMALESFVLLSLYQKLRLSSVFQWFDVGYLLHLEDGSGFHCSKDSPQAEVLDSVQSCLVVPGCCIPGA